MNLFDLNEKKALITGSTKGIGEAIARQFSSHGAKSLYLVGKRTHVNK